MTIASAKTQQIPTAEINMDDIPVIDEKTQQQFEKIAISYLIRKLDWRILPFMFLFELCSYSHRVSIGHANLMGMTSDLHLLPSESSWSVSLFFLAYCIFAIPSSILMRYLGPTRYLSLSTLAWGGFAIGLGFVRNARELLAVRFLIGMTEAGFFPGIIIYFSLWYRKRDQTMRIAILFGAAIISSALAGILAYSFEHMDNILGLQNWQWMFILEGLPMIPLGIITYLFLSNIPDTVQWLDNSEKQLLTNLLQNDAGIINRENARLSWRQVLYVFIDWRIYLFVLIVAGNMAITKYVIIYLPLLVQETGNFEAKVYLMTAPPYVFAFVCCLLASYSASRRNEHSFHFMLCLSVALLGFILMVTLNDRGKTVLYVNTCIACSGVFSAFPLLLSWLTSNVGGYTKRTVAVGSFEAVGHLGGVIFPLVCDTKPTTQRNLCICIGVVAATLILTIILRICLVLENRRRDHLTQEQYDREAAIEEPCDWHPRLRYVY